MKKDAYNRDHLESKYKAISIDIAKLEEQRELDRSSDTKILIQTLKKQKLKLRDELAHHFDTE